MRLKHLLSRLLLLIHPMITLSHLTTLSRAIIFACSSRLAIVLNAPLFMHSGLSCLFWFIAQGHKVSLLSAVFHRDSTHLR